MKTTTAFSTDDIAFDRPADGAVQTGIAQRFARFVGAVRKAAADRVLRGDLAELDIHTLRDIGIADDEIHRVRAKETFTPRAWRE